MSASTIGVYMFNAALCTTLLAWPVSANPPGGSCNVRTVHHVAAIGDEIGSGQTIGLLQPPFANTLGQVGFVGAVTGTNERFVWFNDGIVFRASDDTENTLTGSSATMGISDDGQWMYNPQINGNDGIYTNDGVLLKRGDESPTERRLYATFNSRLQMLGDSTQYFVSGLTNIQGSNETIGRVLYRVDPKGKFDKVFRTGDVVANNVTIRSPNGVGFDYQISDNGKHHIHMLQSTGASPFDFVYVDDSVAVFRGTAVGDGTFWDLFSTPSINNSGNYVFGGATAGGEPGERNFIAANGQIAIRSGDSISGFPIAENALLTAASINNFNEVAFIWRWGPANDRQGALFLGDVSSLGSATPRLTLGEAIDTTANGFADSYVRNFTASTVTGPGLTLTDHLWVHVGVTLERISDGTQYNAIIRLPLEQPGPGCPGDCGVADGVVNVTDLLVLLCNWGQAGGCDLNNDGVVNVSDLLILLGNWGVCP